MLLAMLGLGLQNPLIEATRIVWEGKSKKVRILYWRRDKGGSIQSSARHVKPRMKERGPPRKAKYYLVTDRD